jgi:hypothetical protein
MDNPAHTITYMIAGYAVFFAVTGAYLASLAWRFYRLRREEKYYQSLEKERK